MSQIKSLESLIPCTKEIYIPLEMIELVDKGKSPDLWISQSLENVVVQNQKSLGRALSLKALQERLAQGIAAEHHALQL